MYSSSYKIKVVRSVGAISNIRLLGNDGIDGCGGKGAKSDGKRGYVADYVRQSNDMEGFNMLHS